MTAYLCEHQGPFTPVIMPHVSLVLELVSSLVPVCTVALYPLTTVILRNNVKEMKYCCS